MPGIDIMMGNIVDPNFSMVNESISIGELSGNAVTRAAIYLTKSSPPKILENVLTHQNLIENEGRANKAEKGLKLWHTAVKRRKTKNL